MALGKMAGWVKWHWVKWNWVNCHVTVLFVPFLNEGAATEGKIFVDKIMTLVIISCSGVPEI